MREHREWQKEYEASGRRWRAFKNPATRPRIGDFWLMCEAPELSDGPGRWRRVRLTDNREKHQETTSLGNAVIIVSVRSIIEKLEKATGDSWRATPEKQVHRSDELILTPRDLVAQAYREYEKAEERRAHPPANVGKKEHIDAAQ